MSAIVFDGRDFAHSRSVALAQKVRKLGVTLRMGSIAFVEDPGSVLYTRLKRQAAVRVGMEFSVQELSLKERMEVIQEKVKIYSDREDLEGVLVQKPEKAVWAKVKGGLGGERFDVWWQQVLQVLDPKKDVDCLTKRNLALVYAGVWKVLPATVKAVVSILVELDRRWGLLRGQQDGFDLQGYSVSVIGRSDIVGKPLAAVLRQYGASVNLFGSNLDENIVRRSDVVISATGITGLVKPELIKEGAIVIDVGAPKGDVDKSVYEKASFVTPVPGGVGPVTVVSLLENLLEVASGAFE